MSYYRNDDYIILSPSINGDNIVSRDFKDKHVVYRIERVFLVDEDFYRDGENSGFDYTFSTLMTIVTQDENNYIIHEYYGGIETFFSQRSRSAIFTKENNKTNYDKSYVVNISSLSEKSGSPNFINQLENYYSVAQMSSIKPLIEILKNLLKKERKIFYKKRKIEQESYHKFLKSDEYIRNIKFPEVLSELVKKTHCAYCTKLEIDLSFSFHCDSLCNECITKGIWSI
jgi:hypothetical protein